MDTKQQKELEKFAEYLSEKEETILARWEEEVKKKSLTSTDLLSVSQEIFQDNVPVFLEQFYHSITNQKSDTKVVGKRHGIQRWEHGLDLTETMREWNILQKVLTDMIDQYQDTYSLSIPALRTAKNSLVQLTSDCILFSAKEFNKLQEKEAEAQMRDLEQALQEPDVNETRSHNLRSTSHDLKGIMKNMQMGFFLLEDKSLNDEVAEIINQMSLSANSLEKLLNDLLDLFRLETKREKVEVTEFDVSKTLNELCQSMQPMAMASGLEFQYQGTSSLVINSDSKKIERAARNLILNALKYTTEGSVEVSWKEYSDKQWMLIISDTGPGLSATHARSLTTNADSPEPKFEPSSPEVANKPPEVQNHGEGIGLLIVRHLCSLLNANIDIDTERNVGTTFKILIPKNLENN